MRIQLALSLVLLAVATATGQYTTLGDLDYGGKGDPKQFLDLHIPAGGQVPRPLVIYIHGGGWISGTKGGALGFCDGFLGAGYVVADINYRLSGDSVFPAQVYDCKAAVRWLKGNAMQYGIDTTRIAVTGSSAGGHLASMLGTSGGDPSLESAGPVIGGPTSTVHAVIPFYGPSDFRRMDERIPASPPDSCVHPPIHDSPSSPETAFLGCRPSVCPERAAEASPVAHVDPADPPFLLIHGSFDCTVPPHQSVILDSALRASGVNSTLLIVPHAVHGFRPDSLQKELMLSFLNGIFYGVSSVPLPGVPASSSGLFHNYPNPFNPTTTISYVLAQPSAVHVSVVNILGETIAVLVDRVQDTGMHQVRFTSQGLPGGVYLVSRLRDSLT